MTGHAFRHDVWNAFKTCGNFIVNGTGVGKHLKVKTPGIAPYIFIKFDYSVRLERQIYMYHVCLLF